VAGEKHCGMGVTYTINQLLVKGREEKAFNAILELGYCREWLRQLRGQLDVGLERIDAAFKDLEATGPGLTDRAPKPTKSNMARGSWKPKKRAEPGLGPSGNSKPKVIQVCRGGPISGGGIDWAGSRPVKIQSCNEWPVSECKPTD
jgi:hypothetical protein